MGRLRSIISLTFSHFFGIMDHMTNTMALFTLGGLGMAKMLVEAGMLVLPCALVAMVMLKLMR